MHSLAPRTLLLLGSLLASPPLAAEPELTRLRLRVRGEPCSGVLLRPDGASALLVLAHGQVMSAEHPFMASIGAALARKGIATLRFNFPYAEAKRAKPDPAPLLVEALTAAWQEAAERRGSLPLLVGGKSLGAAIAVEAARRGVVPGAEGIVILGAPLHAPGRPEGADLRPFEAVQRPMLFVEGTRDPLADRAVVAALVERLAGRATLHEVTGADHSFALPAGSGRSQEDVYDEIAGAVAAFAGSLSPAAGP